MKLAIPSAVFAVGVFLVFFGLRKAHGEMMTFQNNPGTPSIAYSPEILAVAGAFVALAAFAPCRRALRGIPL